MFRKIKELHRWWKYTKISQERTNAFKGKIYEIIFEAETREGKLFDLAILCLIIVSLFAVAIESLEHIPHWLSIALYVIEIIATLCFGLEYALRIYCLQNPRKYIFSFYGIIDLVTFLPSALTLTFGFGGSFLFLRILRFLRIFRILKLTRFLTEQQLLLDSLRKSVVRILVFLTFVCILVMLLASIMYLVEPPESGLSSIPQCIYWAIVTITTVGYGDLTPISSIGQIISVIVMLLGYAILAIPTGIITSEMIHKNKSQISTEVCPHCLREGHDSDAVFCKYCGKKLNN